MQIVSGIATQALAALADWRISRIELNPRARAGLLALGRRNNGARRRPPRAIVQEIQSIRLRRTVCWVAERSPFYREKFAELGITPRDIRGVQDMARLPLTTPADLQEASRFLCVPRDEIKYIFTTSGTNRAPKQMHRTARDFERMVNLAAFALRRRKWQERVVCMIAHAHGMFGLVEPAQAVTQRAGGLALPVGQPAPAEALEHMRRYRPNAIMTSPSYMAALTRAAERAGMRMPLRSIVLDGEILTLAQAEKFADFWGAEVVNGYGLTELGVLAFGLGGCDALHFNPLAAVTEVLDPQTGQPADEGELVVTSLVQEGMPLLRYRTGDRVRRVECRCGWTAPAIHVFGRFGDSIVVAASNLHGPLIAGDIAKIEGVTGSLELLVDHVDGVDRMTLRVGTLPGQTVCPDAVAQKLFALYPPLADDRRAEAFELKVELVENLRLSPKPLRVKDLRK